jgi:hypothetical protein
MDYLNKGTWNTEQQIAIDLLAKGGFSYEEIAQSAKVSTHRVFNWRKDPSFMNAVIERAREILKEELPDIYHCLVSKAKEGDPRHIEIVLKHLEKLEEMKTKYAQNSVTFTWDQPLNVSNNS